MKPQGIVFLPKKNDVVSCAKSNIIGLHKMKIKQEFREGQAVEIPR